MTEIWLKLPYFLSYLFTIFLLRKFTISIGKELEALLGLGMIYFLFFSSSAISTIHFCVLMGICLFVFMLQSFLFHLKIQSLVAYIPMAALISVKLAPHYTLAHYSIWFGSESVPFFVKSGLVSDSSYIGFSYLMLRWSLLATEVRAGNNLKFPTLSEYFGFGFFVPTFFIGPISRFNHFRMSQRGEFQVSWRVFRRAAERLAVGLVKVQLLSPMLLEQTFSKLHPEVTSLNLVEFLYHCLVYFFFLYCNFSGICDLIIGCSALTGTKLDENFRSPFFARNLKEFWSRWHMTLTRLIQILIFNPLAKQIVKYLPKGIQPLVVPLATGFSFVAIGLWHGLELRFLIFGVLNALGVALVHYWDLILRYLPTKIRQTYLQSVTMTVIGSILTLFFFAISLFFFENNSTQINKVLELITFLNIGSGL